MLEVSVFFDEDDMVEGKRLYEYIMQYLIHHHVRGATVFAAMGGYGQKRHLHFPRRIGNADEGPMMILFIDDREKVEKVLPHLKEVIREGLIVTKRVDQV